MRQDTKAQASEFAPDAPEQAEVLEGPAREGDPGAGLVELCAGPGRHRRDALWGLLPQSLGEVAQRVAVALDLHDDASPVVQGEAAQAALGGQPVNERPEADSLHDTADDDPPALGRPVVELHGLSIRYFQVRGQDRWGGRARSLIRKSTARAPSGRATTGLRSISAISW